MKKLYKIGYYLFIVALLCVGVLLISTLFPIPGNYQVKVVLSGSMEPAIKVGSLVVIKQASSYDTGDVITFGKDDKNNVPTTHRIVDSRVESGKMIFKTKGDANDNPDPREARESEVIGKVRLSIPYLGFVLDMARKPLGFAILVGIPAGLVGADEAHKIFKEIKKMRGRRKEHLSDKDAETTEGEDENEDNEKV